ISPQFSSLLVGRTPHETGDTLLAVHRHVGTVSKRGGFFTWGKHPTSPWVKECPTVGLYRKGCRHMKFQDLKITEVRMLSFHNFKITAVLAGDRVETFEFNSREE